MRRLMLPLLALLALLTIACVAPPTALPQSAPAVALFKQVLTSAGGDSVPVYGTFRFTITIDSVDVTRQPAETVTVCCDTVWIPKPDTIAPVPVTRGIPFGPFGAWDGGTLQPNTEAFSLGMGSVSPTTILARITAARAQQRTLLVALAGGKHTNYLTGGVFDMAKWRARMDSYATPAITAAVAAAVADGTLLGNILMDEPANTAADNSWGPAGTMSKARVDSMAVYARTLFPTLPMGVTLDARIWPEQRFREVDFVVSQYRVSKGPVLEYRDRGVALGDRDGHAILFSMNILDGGTAGTTCPTPATGGPGTYGRNCRMSPAQVREFGVVLGPAGCALLLWRYDSAFVANSANQRAFKDVAAALADRPARSCRRA